MTAFWSMIVFLAVPIVGIRSRGLRRYLLDYFRPNPLLAPLHVISELSRTLALSMRLFGNIMGGSIIILVVSYLTWSIVLPPFLYAFFGMFVGTIQAFVFTMLTVVYISVQVK